MVRHIEGYSLSHVSLYWLLTIVYGGGLRGRQKNKFLSPASRSLTAWWAIAAGWREGRGHWKGPILPFLGGTRSTPGGYKGYVYMVPFVVYGIPLRWANLWNSDSANISWSFWCRFSSSSLLLLLLLLFPDASKGFESSLEMLKGSVSLTVFLVCADRILFLSLGLLEKRAHS